MNVSMPKFEISISGLLRKRQTALSPLLFSRKRSLTVTIAGAIVSIRISIRLISVPIENHGMGIFSAQL